VKLNPKGEVAKYKPTLVAKDFLQKQDFHFGEVFFQITRQNHMTSGFCGKLSVLTNTLDGYQICLLKWATRGGSICVSHIGLKLKARKSNCRNCIRLYMIYSKLDWNTELMASYCSLDL